jgi:hypothetical protein
MGERFREAAQRQYSPARMQTELAAALTLDRRASEEVDVLDLAAHLPAWDDGGVRLLG